MLIFRKPLWSAPGFLPTVCLGTFLVALLVSLPAPAVAAPAVTWNPDSLSQVVAPGSSETTSATFTANKDLSNVQISIVPELQPFVTVSPTSFGFLADGQTRTVDVTITVPSGTQTGNVDGTLHVTAAGGEEWSGETLRYGWCGVSLVDPPRQGVTEGDQEFLWDVLTD